MGWFVMINVLNLFFSLSYFLFWTNNYTLSLNLRIVNLIKLIPFNLYNCEKLTKNSVKTNIFTQHKFLHKFFLNWYKLFLCSSKNINYCDSILKIYYKYIYYYYIWYYYKPQYVTFVTHQSHFKSNLYGDFPIPRDLSVLYRYAEKDDKSLFFPEKSS